MSLTPTSNKFGTIGKRKWTAN